MIKPERRTSLLQYIKDIFGKFEKERSFHVGGELDLECHLLTIPYKDFPDLKIYMTLGLCDFNFKLDCSDEKCDGSIEVKQELIFACADCLEDKSYTLQTFVKLFIKNNSHFLYAGETIDLKQNIFEDLPFTGFYIENAASLFDGMCCNIFYKEKELHFYCIIPIYKEELLYCREHGWEKFEALSAEKEGVDLFNLQRVSLIEE